MAFNIEAVIWYAFLLDSVGANVVAWTCHDWFMKRFPRLFKHFPLRKGWALLYLSLVLWVGSVLLRLEVLPW